MPITLIPLDTDNLSDCFHLRVTDEQRNQAVIEEMPEMIAYMKQNTSCVLLTIYNDDTMVGFIAYSPVEGTSDYQIHRFLIDKNHQRRGYGESALSQVMEKIYRETVCERIIINYMSFNDTAANLYIKLGFNETDEFQQPEELEAELGPRFAVHFNSQASLAAEADRLQCQIERLQAQLDKSKGAER